MRGPTMTIIAFATLVCGISAAPMLTARTWRSMGAAEKASYGFESFVDEFGKQYSKDTYVRRKAVFEANLAKIHAHNTAGHSWTAGVNQFTDLTVDEFRARTKGRSWASYTAEGSQEYVPSGEPLPKSVDWRTKKAIVSPVKNQGGCGSCWAFSATESVESAVAIATGTLYVLAPQEFVDCVPNPDECGGTGGCEGATAELAFNYTMAAGMALEKSYEYKGRDGECQMEAGVKSVVGITDFVKLPSNNQSALLDAVATKGPISISVDAGSWMMYEKGIFSHCPANVDIDHAVQLVGYGEGFYLVRNSWGAGWGEEGYIRIEKQDKEKCFIDEKPGDGYGCKGGPKKIQTCGPCGILSDSAYPTGAHEKKA